MAAGRAALGGSRAETSCLGAGRRQRVVKTRMRAPWEQREQEEANLTREETEKQSSKYIARRPTMPNYKEMYIQSFNAMTDAIHALQNKQFDAAMKILKAAQLKAEETYIKEEKQETVFYIYGAEHVTK
jgi:hypothetical protein